MNSYVWDIKNLESKLNELKKRIEVNKINELDIITLNEMLGKHSDDSYLKLSAIQEEETKKIQPLFLELASNFYKNYLFNRIEFPSVKVISLSNEEILDLIHDFYKTRSTTFYNYFLKSFSRRNINLQISSNLFKSSAITYHLLAEKESYLNLDRTNTIFDSINLAHEYGHTITFLMNPNFITNPNFTFIRELGGLFFQTQFIEYLIENNIFKEEAILAQLNINLQMSSKARFFQAGKFNLYNAVYFFSYLVNIELCIMKDHAEEMLEKIIKGNPQSAKELLETLNSYVTLNENAANFQQKLKKQLDKNFIH